jgi:PAS domain S-box-containing protein
MMHLEEAVMQSPLTPLEASEIRYRRLFEGARDGILILDLDTLTIIDANPYLQELLGYEKDELLGKELWEIGLVKDQAASQHLYRELQRHGYVRYDDLPLQAKDGQAREVEFVSNVYEEIDGPVIQCNIRDISQRKLEDVWRERQVQTEKLKLLGQMARGVAHDLNQSLGLISGYGDLAIAALAGPSLDRAVLLDMLEVIARAAVDGGTLVSRLLTFARGQPDGPAEPVPLAVLLANAGHLTAPRWRDAALAEGRTITLTVDAAPDLMVTGWPASLREALVNLIFNAVDALPDGGTIRLGAHQEGRIVTVEVQDSGIGMSPEVQAQALQPLFTTKGERGTGLGLTQVANAVKQHGGNLAIESAPGQGTTFRLLLPTDPALRGTRPQPRMDGSLHVLILDDEPALADILARMLRLDNHTATVVHEGAAALERLEMETFDLVISDMGMPGMDGWEFARQVRSRHPKTVLIVASGWGSQITAEEMQEYGIRGVVPKPYRRADLQKAIADLSRPDPNPAWRAPETTD